MIATALQLIILFVFILCGFTVGKIKKISLEKSNLLSMLLVNVFLPSKIFLNFSNRCTLSYFKDNYPTLLISTALLLVLVLVSLILSKVLTQKPYERKVYRYSFAISNYAYLGYVFVEATLGAQALTDMILFCIPFAFYTYTFGYALLSNKGNSLKKMLNPMTVAIALGMIFGILNIPVPAFVSEIFSLASGCAGPLSMLLTGIVFATLPLKALLPNLKAWLFCAIRLILLPALLFLICIALRALGLLTNAVYPAAVIMGSMPCGLNTIVFPSLVGEDCSMGARFVLLSHLLCLITIPLWMYILI